MYQPPHTDNDNGSLLFSIRNSPEWPSVGLPSPHPSIPTLNEPDEEQHRDDTISSLANFSHQESSYNGSVRTARFSKLSFDSRRSTPTPNLLGQDTRAPHSHSRSQSGSNAYLAHSQVYAWPSQHYGATSLQAVLPSPPPQTIDGLQAGPSTPLRPPVISSASSTTSTNTTTGAVHMSSAIGWDRMAHTDRWVRSLDMHNVNHESAWSPGERPIGDIVYPGVNKDVASGEKRGPGEAKSAGGILAENEGSFKFSSLHERVTEWLREVSDTEASEETSKDRTGNLEQIYVEPAAELTTSALSKMYHQQTGGASTAGLDDSDLVSVAAQYNYGYEPSFSHERVTGWLRHVNNAMESEVTFENHHNTVDRENSEPARYLIVPPHSGGITGPVVPSVPPPFFANYLPPQQAWAPHETDQLYPERAGTLWKPKWLETLAGYARTRTKTWKK